MRDEMICIGNAPPNMCTKNVPPNNCTERRFLIESSMGR